MTNEQVAALASYIKLWNPYGVPAGLHRQVNAEARLAFLDKNVPDERKMTKFYGVGEINLRRIVQSVAESDFNNLVEMQNKFDAEMAKYRAREESLIDDEYALYVHTISRHNDSAKYDRRKKIKPIMTRAEFVDTLPTI